MNVQRLERRLPLWRLELELEQAQRRFKRTEEEHRRAEQDMNRIRNEIADRRKEMDND